MPATGEARRPEDERDLVAVEYVVPPRVAVLGRAVLGPEGARVDRLRAAVDEDLPVGQLPFEISTPDVEVEEAARQRVQPQERDRVAREEVGPDHLREEAPLRDGLRIRHGAEEDVAEGGQAEESDDGRARGAVAPGRLRGPGHETAPEKRQVPGGEGHRHEGEERDEAARAERE